MMHLGGVVVSSQVTFGRDAAMFEKLLDFVAQLSIGLWSLVILTLVMRFVGVRIYRRIAARSAPVETAVPSPVVLPAERPTPTVEIDLSQPSAGQPTDSGLVRLGLLGPVATLQDVRPAKRDDALRPAGALGKVSRRPLLKRRAPRGSGERVPALTANSTEA